MISLSSYIKLSYGELEKKAAKAGLPVYSGHISGNIDRYYVITELNRINHRNVILCSKLVGLVISIIALVLGT